MARSAIIGGMEVTAVTAFLREYRLLKKISQKALAEAIGLSPRQTNRWERGRSQLKEEQLLRAMHYLKIPMAAITELITKEEATAEDGRKAAREWISRTDDAMKKVAPSLTDDERLQIFFKATREMKDTDPPSFNEMLINALLWLQGHGQERSTS